MEPSSRHRRKCEGKIRMSKPLVNSQLTRLMQEFLRPFDASGLVTQDGDVLALKYETLADIGTLGIAANTVVKYFPLNEGDIVLLNDPYSGGSVLSSLSLITPLHSASSSIYWVIRTQFRPNLVLSARLEEEGLRIPPTPLVQGRQINKPVFEAILSHPQCPQGLQDRIETIVPEIFRRVDHFRRLMKKHGDLFSKANLKSYIKSSADLLSEIVAETPHGEAKVETTLDSGEVIKLKAELSQQHLSLDFSGTSPSKRVCLTDAATFGACMGAFQAFLGVNLPLNAGTFSFIDVMTPLGSLLNSKYPSPTFKGMTEGTSIVASTVVKALTEMAPSRSCSISAAAPTLVSFEFGKTKKFFDSLAGGVGASSQGDGADALQFWVRNRLRNSVEEIESSYPLVIRRIVIRQGSGGKGQHRGGNGLIKEYEVRDSAVFAWMIEQRKNTPQGLKGAQNGQPGEIIVIRNGAKESLDLPEGSLELKKGDRVIVSTAGGGGFGKG